MGLFQDSLAAAVTDLRDHTGVTVTYSRGAASVAIVATEAPQQYEAQDSGGMIVTYDCHDWLIVAADLLLDLGEGAAAIRPVQGDWVTEAGGTVHEVMMIPGRNCYDTCRGGLRYRVHTKIVSEP